MERHSFHVVDSDRVLLLQRLRWSKQQQVGKVLPSTKSYSTPLLFFLPTAPLFRFSRPSRVIHAHTLRALGFRLVRSTQCVSIFNSPFFFFPAVHLPPPPCLPACLPSSFLGFSLCPGFVVAVTTQKSPNSKATARQIVRH